MPTDTAPPTPFTSSHRACGWSGRWRTTNTPRAYAGRTARSSHTASPASQVRASVWTTAQTTIPPAPRATSRTVPTRAARATPASSDRGNPAVQEASTQRTPRMPPGQVCALASVRPTDPLSSVGCRPRTGRGAGDGARQGAAMGCVVQARGVRKTYRSGPVTALDGVDVDVETGELVAIVGASGTGKSTLLSCLPGLETVDAGVVVVEGERLDRLDDDGRTARRGRRMGFVFQDFHLLPV